MAQILPFITGVSARKQQSSSSGVAYEIARKVRVRYARLQAEERAEREIKRQELNLRLVVLVTKHTRGGQEKYCIFCTCQDFRWKFS